MQARPEAKSKQKAATDDAKSSKDLEKDTPHSLKAPPPKSLLRMKPRNRS